MFKGCVFNGHVAVTSSNVIEIMSYRGHVFKGHVFNGYVAVTSSKVMCLMVMLRSRVQMLMR